MTTDELPDDLPAPLRDEFAAARAAQEAAVAGLGPVTEIRRELEETRRARAPLWALFGLGSLEDTFGLEMERALTPRSAR